ncbi:glycosyltransferase [Candidatus Saccharibacteria bacterium]|nr:glycosyltransferase [Candidatus Saccharibacteria bacterium]
MKPLVSIIVPVYNVRDYVAECLKSLIKQSYHEIEIIIVDDGATDGSEKICDEFAKKDKRVRVFHKENGGLSSARNYGIKKAKGEYVCLVDSDDYVKSGFVAKMVEAIFDGVDVVVCGYNEEIPKARVLTGKEATVKLLLEQDNMEIIAWNKMYKRVLFDGVLYPEGKNYEDNLTTYKLLNKANKVRYIKETLYVYRERAESITRNDNKEERLKYREMAAKEAEEYFANDYSLGEVTKIAVLTAKLAWIDFAISGEVSKEFLNVNIKWVAKNKKTLLENKYLNQKLRLYIHMITILGGKIYIVFRKIRHEKK